MIAFEPGLYVRIKELAEGPQPRPLSSGFNSETAYRVLGIHNPSETAEAYLILSNDRDEIWFISNRHTRTVSLIDQITLRIPLEDLLLEKLAPALPPQRSIRDRRFAEL